MTIQDLAPVAPPAATVEQTPDPELARHGSGDIAMHCHCAEPAPTPITWFGTSQCGVCLRAIFRNGKPVRA